MTGGQNLDMILIRSTDSGDIGSETVRGEILAEGLIDLAQCRRKGSPEVKAGPGIGAADRGQQCWADAVTGDVGENNGEPSIREHFPIEEVAPRFVCAAIPTRNFKSSNVWAHSRKERLLDGS